MNKGKKLIEEEAKKYLKDIQLTIQQYMFSVQVPVQVKNIDNQKLPQDPLFMMQKQNTSRKNLIQTFSTLASNLISVVKPNKEFQKILEKIRQQTSQKPIMNDLPFFFTKPENKNDKEIFFTFVLNSQFCYDFLKSSERRNDLIFHISNIIQFLLNKELYIFEDFKTHGPIMIQYLWEQSELLNKYLSKESNFQQQIKLQVNTKYNNRLEEQNIQKQTKNQINNTQDLVDEIKKNQNKQKTQEVQIQNQNFDQNTKKGQIKIEVLEERNEVIQDVDESEKELFKKQLV